MSKQNRKNHKPCRDCGQTIRLEQTASGKVWAVNMDQSAHFLTCPKAKARLLQQERERK